MAFATLFKVFLWKNLLFLKFNIWVLLPVFVGCFGIIWAYLGSTNQLQTIPQFIYDSKPFEILQDNFPLNDDDHVYYAPATPKLDEFMEGVRIEMQISGESFKPLKTVAEMKWVLEQNCRGNCFGIVFENFPSEQTNDNNLRYSISSAATRVSPKKQYVNDEEINGIKEDDDYVRTGFLTLQHAVDRAYIKNRSGNNINIKIAALPTISQNVTDSQRHLSFGSIYSVLFSVLLLSTFLVPLVEEKQDGLKEFLVVATPLNFLNGATFFLVRLTLYLIFLSGVLIVANFYNALGITSGFHVFYIILLFLLYTLSAMSYAYLVSVCFNSVFYAKVGGLMLFIIPYIFYLLKGSLSYVATFMFSTKTFLDGLHVFQIFFNKHRVFTVEDLFHTNITASSFKLISIYIILLLQCFFYALLYNYLSCVFPGPGGLKKPYLFFLKSSFYKKKQRNQYTTCERGTDAIIIQDLEKKFKTPTRTITIADRLNMVIKSKQITVLLGHNGAGKTTTLNMIMGSEPKDSGTILVCSERDVASYRHLIGFCPQHCVFMYYMNCQQHLEFFAQLRGMTKKEAHTLAINLLKQLKLVEKANEYGRNLSGGMKRRLSLGIALSGETKIIVLDEPSSGLDIESRRELWDILLELRKAKAILVTTHHMEEAEVLGDTICILSHGRLQRTGTPLELKRKVGCGYILKLSVDSEKFNEQDTLRFIQQDVPECRVLNVVPPTTLISLPYAYKANYSRMLQKLENECKERGISSISITDTSLEDVFLNCATEVDQVDAVDSSGKLDTTRMPYQRLDKSFHVDRSQQFKAVFYKKLIFLRSEWLYTAVMILLPVLCTILAVTLIRSMSVLETEDALLLRLKQIKSGRIYIHNAEASDRIVEILKKDIEKNNIEVKELHLHDNQTIPTEMLQIMGSSLADFQQNAIGVIDIVSSGSAFEFSIYYSGNIHHSSVILTNLVDNAVLQLATIGNSKILTTYAPLRRFITDISPTRLEYFAVILPIGLFFYMFFYVSLPFKEHESGFKSLQAIPRCTYWFSVLAFDLLLHLFVSMLVACVLALITSRALYSTTEQITIVISIYFYGLSYLPILYSFANSFRSISTISTYLLFMFIVSAIVPLITSGNIAAMQYHEVKITFLSILPDFNLNHQLRVINENFVISRNKLSTQEPLSVGAFFVNAIVIFTLSMLFFLHIVENKEKRQKLSQLLNCYNCRQVSTKSPITQEEEESLVMKEKAVVDDILREKTQSDYSLLVSDLYKFYNRKAAVCGINFVVKKRECFGLLGVNGAGKTSTFQMVTANITVTGGTIKIDGVDILEHENAYRERFGYCPQNDCLNNFMTAFEMLRYIAMLRGLRNADIINEVKYWLEKLDLEKYQMVQVRHYSGGTKRKLNAAVAMIGSPSLVLLDEPTTGVDPVSRRFLWKCIQDFQKREKTVVLTSHSMDECEHLCNRLAIMADGKFKCLGYVQDLKRFYGSGFTIKVKLCTQEPDAHHICDISMHMKEQFPESELRENHAGMLTYFIKNINNIAWSDVFIRTEKFFDSCRTLVEDYSVNESTLEDIFLKFASRGRSLDMAACCEEV